MSLLPLSNNLKTQVSLKTSANGGIGVKEESPKLYKLQDFVFTPTKS